MLRPGFHNPEKHSRFFKKGDLKYVILDILKDKPSHGYEIIQILEERLHGMYSPNAGSIYPVLQLLEDMGYVTSILTDGKKVYTVTDTGKTFLEDQKDAAGNVLSRMRDLCGPCHRENLNDIRTALNYSREIHHLISQTAARQDYSKIRKINELLVKTLRAMEQIYKE